ncbi:FkbM family methyltransferase [Roseibium sp. SCPC15]|uniref:FkbM family methyltransferase n=1 Tax=Roseibium sp. SCP15 TaxID=3141376 RepID=UPI0033390F0C
MNYFEARYRRLWKSYAKRMQRFRLYNHYFHNRLLLDMSEPTSRELFAGYEYEFSEYELVTNSLKAEPADIFYDIGANWGGYSLLAARAGVQQIESFEPNRKVFGILAANITLNSFHSQIRAWNIAAGNVDETGFLSIDPRATDVSSLSPERMSEKWDYCDKQECLIRRIDSFMPATDKSVFVKIDVEGHELEVLDGLKGILDQNRVRLLVEVLGASNFKSVAEGQYGLSVKQSFGSNMFLTNF